MDAVDEGDNGGSLSRECSEPLEPFERGSVGDSALNASPWLLVRRSSAIFWRRSSGGSGGWLAMLASLRLRFASAAVVVVVGAPRVAALGFASSRRAAWVRRAQGAWACSELSWTSVGGRLRCNHRVFAASVAFGW